jgi:Protein of unknown function (DUF3592)
MALIKSDLARKRLRYAGIAIFAIGAISVIFLEASGATVNKVYASVAIVFLILGVIFIALGKTPVPRSLEYWRQRDWAQRGVMIFILSVTAMMTLPFACWNLFEGYSSQHWPQVSGTITAAKIITGRSGKGGVTYQPEISYQYTVGGAGYNAERISFPEPLFSSLDSAQTVLQLYPLGKTVSVFYSPWYPGHAALRPGISKQPGVSKGIWLTFGTGMFIAVFLVLVVFTNRTRKPKRYRELM